MPTGVPIKYLHCRKCPEEKFKSIGDLRRHQWSFHKETFANLFAARPKAIEASRVALKKKAARERTAKARAVSLVKRASVREFITQGGPSVNGDMTVSQLITELESQHKVLGDMIALISGIQSRHGGAHHE